jgi:hypothetical protein
VIAVVVAVLVALAAPPLDLLRSAVNPNPSLQTYTAAATLQAELHAVIPVHETFVGTATYHKPVRTIDFPDVGGPLRRFRQLSNALPSYQELTTQYAIVPGADDGTSSTFVLTPTAKDARVANLTLSVDDHQTLVTKAVWLYHDGSRLTINVGYTTIAGYHLATQEHIVARFPAYSVDGDLRLSDFRF